MPDLFPVEPTNEPPRSQQKSNPDSDDTTDAPAEGQSVEQNANQTATSKTEPTAKSNIAEILAEVEKGTTSSPGPATDAIGSASVPRSTAKSTIGKPLDLAAFPPPHKADDPTEVVPKSSQPIPSTGTDASKTSDEPKTGTSEKPSIPSGDTTIKTTTESKPQVSESNVLGDTTIRVPNPGDQLTPPDDPSPTTASTQKQPSVKSTGQTPKPSPAIVAAGRPSGKPKTTSRRLLSPLGGLITIPLLLVAGLYISWLLFGQSAPDEAAQRVEVYDTDVSGLSGSELSDAIATAAQSRLNEPLKIRVGDTVTESTAGELGADVNIETTTERTLSAHRRGPGLLRPFEWANSFINDATVEPTYVVDSESAAATEETVFANLINPVVETSLTTNNRNIVVRPGEDGQRIDPTEIEDELPGVLGTGNRQLTLSPIEGKPEITTEQAQVAADDANNSLGDDIEILILDQSTTLDAADLQELVALNHTDDDVTWVIDNDEATELLNPRFTNLGTDAQEAKFTIVNDEPIVLPVADAIECCDENSGPALTEAVKADDPSVRLQPLFVQPDPTAEALTELGITEEVSSFTTPHQSDEARVTNIQNFADLMRGTVIRVGETQSLNETVGERTLENGFVADSAINQGVIEPQVGGGISQFATTYFNAAFFSGIQIDAYQFHTLAIPSRYPLGRESTISFPQPDVAVTNTSEHAILVWTSYTATSITVTFYSVKHLTVRDANGDQLQNDVYDPANPDPAFSPAVESDRECEVYTTTRFTEYPNGDIVQDAFSGFYRPDEGLDCDGEKTELALQLEEEEKMKQEMNSVPQS